VLIVGGWEASSYHDLASAELYDPMTGTFTATSDMTRGWLGPAATLLPDSKVLVSAAYNPGSWGSQGAYGELYDPLSGTFTNWNTMTRSSFFWYSWHTASLLQNGKVLIAGGGCAEIEDYLASAGIYDPDTGTFADT